MLLPAYACLKNIGANPLVIAFFFILYNPPCSEPLKLDKCLKQFIAYAFDRFSKLCDDITHPELDS